MLAADHDYGVYMVRHHHEPIQGNIAVVAARFRSSKSATLPAGDRRMLPLAISPRRQARSRTQIVTKYQPAVR